MDNKQLERELDDLERSLALLKRDYEIYFSGGAKLPPNEAHKRSKIRYESTRDLQT